MFVAGPRMDEFRMNCGALGEWTVLWEVTAYCFPLVGILEVNVLGLGMGIVCVIISLVQRHGSMGTVWRVYVFV